MSSSFAFAFSPSSRCFSSAGRGVAQGKRSAIPFPKRQPLLIPRANGIGLQETSTTTNSHGGSIGRREATILLLTTPYFLDISTNLPSLAGEEGGQKIACELTATTSGLAFCDTIVGTGTAATKGQVIKAHYVGKLENGKVFDSSYSRGTPLTFRVGVGEVIKGWDVGILGDADIPPMLAGGKRTLKIPPDLGYGMRGAGCRGGSCIIPPESTLLFDVELVGNIP